MIDQPKGDIRSDAILIQACQNGDTEAFRMLYQRHQRIVRATLYYLCDATTLDDLVQEVFLRAWKGMAKMQQQAKFSTWLYRIAWNVGADYRRQVSQMLTQQESLQVFPDQLSVMPWQEMHHQDLVNRGLRSLSPDHALVVVLHDLQEIPQPEIAQILEIPLGTVKSRLFHARSTLRKFFEGEGISL